MSAPEFKPLLQIRHQAAHVLSACLFHEPEWAQRFPGRKFEQRYLSGAEALRDFLSATGWQLTLWVDAAMAGTALRFAEAVQAADVYQVTTAPRFAFDQHLWRYYSVLLPGATCSRAIHFRGMDDLLPNATWQRLAEELQDGGDDLLHWPCRQGGGRLYVPVRGKCSVAHAGVLSLRAWLRTHEPHDWKGDHWTNRWHADEAMLTEWFNARQAELHTITVRNSWLGPDFKSWLMGRQKSGIRRTQVHHWPPKPI